jgi:hypothetical protein
MTIFKLPTYAINKGDLNLHLITHVLLLDRYLRNSIVISLLEKNKYPLKATSKK